MDWYFFRTFFKDKDVASIAPTSVLAVRRICRSIEFSKDNIFVEYGPGTGAFTNYILKQMTPKSRVIAIESNADFVRHLRKISDERLTVVKGNAENVKAILSKEGFTNADYVISGIPLSFLSPEAKTKLLKDTYEILAVNGKFLVYQFRSKIKKEIKAAFDKARTAFYPWNIPPLTIVETIKGS